MTASDPKRTLTKSPLLTLSGHWQGERICSFIGVVNGRSNWLGQIMFVIVQVSAMLSDCGHFLFRQNSNRLRVLKTPLLGQGEEERE
jgi:hypothetical protein